MQHHKAQMPKNITNAIQHFPCLCLLLLVVCDFSGDLGQGRFSFMTKPQNTSLVYKLNPSMNQLIHACYLIKIEMIRHLLAIWSYVIRSTANTRQMQYQLQIVQISANIDVLLNFLLCSNSIEQRQNMEIINSDYGQHNQTYQIYWQINQGYALKGLRTPNT